MRLGLKKFHLYWIPSIGFYIEHPSLSVPTPQKLFFSSISITSALLLRSNATFGFRGPIYETMPRERMENVVT
jgi:hypothetical protein